MTISAKMLRLPEILRDAGCQVVEWPGWRDRQRPWDFDPIALMLHHDGSPVGPADFIAQCRFLFEIGRPAEGIPAPLCQVWIDYNGRWVIGAAGGANHAGEGGGWGVVDANRGNQQCIGVEMDNTLNEPTRPEQYEALHRGLPAIFRAFGWNPMDALTAHKEYAQGRKPDPDDIDMNALRRDVAAGGGDWFDMATKEDLAEVVRSELNRGTGAGQVDWASTSKATLGTVQGTVNLVNGVASSVERIPVSSTVIKLPDQNAQWLATELTSGVSYREWIESGEALAKLDLQGRYEEVPPEDPRWAFVNVNGHMPTGWPPEIG